MGVRVAKPSNEKKQRVRPRRKRARARVSRDETKYRLPRAHLAHLCHRHRISRGLSLRDPSDLSLHRPFATDAVASCKLKVDPKTPPPPFDGPPRAMRPRPIEPRAQPKIRSEGTPGPPRAVFSAFFASPGSHARNDRLRARRRSAQRFFSTSVSNACTVSARIKRQLVVCVCSLKKGKKALHFSVTVYSLNARAHSRANFVTRHATSARRCRSFEVAKSRTGRNFR